MTTRTWAAGSGSNPTILFSRVVTAVGVCSTRVTSNTPSSPRPRATKWELPGPLDPDAQHVTPPSACQAVRARRRGAVLMDQSSRDDTVVVAHLLTHTAGIGYWLQFSYLLRAGVGSGARAPRRCRRSAITAGPPGFAVLGQIAQDITGQPLDRYLLDRGYGTSVPGTSHRSPTTPTADMLWHCDDRPCRTTPSPGAAAVLHGYDRPGATQNATAPADPVRRTR